MKIREMIAQDFENCYQLWEQSRLKISSKEEERAEFLNCVDKNPKTCLVYLDSDQKIIGTIMGGFDGKKGYMYRLAVSSDFRNHGLGTQLIQKVEDAFKKQGVKNVRLTVMIYKLNLIDFYNHRGYESLTDEMEMEKKL